MIDLEQVGAHPERMPDGRWKVRVGIYLPGITPQKGYQVRVRIIHEQDQFVRGIEPEDFQMTWASESGYDFWHDELPLYPRPGSHFGQTGRYLYRFQLLRNNQPVVFWFSDPFGREAGLGTFSAFTVDPSETAHQWDDSSFQVPHIDDMVVYELHAGEFNQTFHGIEKQIEYLWGLGVNVIEIMPFTNVKEDVEWGYTPLAYFAPDERHGGGPALRRLVNACHQKGIAVLLDAVYAHAHPEFAYNLVYDATREVNPMMGHFEGEFFPDRPGTDFRKGFTRDYFLALNRYWLEEFHLDGFRYDYVPGMFDGPAGQGYAYLTYHTYQLSKPISRFQDEAGHSRIIQCAEHLPDPRGIMSSTYSNCCWQNELMDKAADTAIWRYIDASYALLLDPAFTGYPVTHANPETDESFPVAPFQYIESHDNRRFLARIAPGRLKDLIGEPYGDRSQFYRVQPYVIALFTGNGVPMLWQGQEFGENWGMASWGLGRNLFARPLHWEFFYDRFGKALVRLYRIMGTLRRSFRALNSRGSFYYYNDSDHAGHGVIVFRREVPPQEGHQGEVLMICINFSELDQTVSVSFPEQGSWVEQIDKDELSPRPTITVSAGGQRHQVTVPSFYGCIYAKS